MKTNLTILSSLFLLLFGLPAQAAVYSVKGAGGGNYTTIQACSNAAVAGDTCEVYVGSYAGWTQSVSGGAGNPITFTAHAGDTVAITSNVTISSRSYITITRLNFSGAAILGNGTTAHNVIDHNTFINKALVFSIPDGLGSNGSDNVFSSNTVNINSTTSTQPALYLFGDRNRIESNEIYGGGGDCMEIGGQNVVVRGNYCHNLDGAISGEHIDFVQVIGSGTTPTLSFSLIENNIEQNCTNDGSNCHFVIIRTGSGPVADTVITRFNYVQNIDGSGFSMGGLGDSVPNARLYNNTIATEKRLAGNGECGSFQNAANGVALNNLCYNVTAPASTWAPFYDFTASGGGLPNDNGNMAFTSGYADIWGAPYPSEATYSSLHNQDPKFASYPTNGRLQANSPAINAGVALTAVGSTDSGSGTSLVVSDARFFQPGWAGTQGDWIRVGASTTAQIASINYATNTLTLASAVTRSNGDPVYLYKNSAGTALLFDGAPNVGAYQSGPAPTPPTNLRIIP